MTIARRLIILLTVPLLALVGLGLFTGLQLAIIEERKDPLREPIDRLHTLAVECCQGLGDALQRAQSRVESWAL